MKKKSEKNPSWKKGILVVAFLAVLTTGTVLAAPNIDSVERWAWNDVIGWIDFEYNENPNVEVGATELNGYASSSVGFLSLNCATGPPGSDCTNSYSVTNTSGTLAGWAWSEQIGWVSFNCDNSGIGDTCATSNYEVTISGGDFSGWAWNDLVGWISFNCLNTATCGTADYQVLTTWGSGPATGTLMSSIIDTQETKGVAIETIMWQGSLNSGEVEFQLASSDSSSGPWSFIGPDGTGSTYYGGGTTGPNTQIRLTNVEDHNNKRYFRYQIFLQSDAGGSQSPQINDIIIGYNE